MQCTWLDFFLKSCIITKLIYNFCNALFNINLKFRKITCPHLYSLNDSKKKVLRSNFIHGPLTLFFVNFYRLHLCVNDWYQKYVVYTVLSKSFFRVILVYHYRPKIFMIHCTRILDLFHNVIEVHSEYSRTKNYNYMACIQWMP